MIDKKRLREQLERYRSIYSNCFVGFRLKMSPFDIFDDPFNLGNLRLTEDRAVRFPCIAFGRHLTLKIIDEILDE